MVRKKRQEELLEEEQEQTPPTDEEINAETEAAMARALSLSREDQPDSDTQREAQEREAQLLQEGPDVDGTMAEESYNVHDDFKYLNDARFLAGNTYLSLLQIPVMAANLTKAQYYDMPPNKRRGKFSLMFLNNYMQCMRSYGRKGLEDSKDIIKSHATGQKQASLEDIGM